MGAVYAQGQPTPWGAADTVTEVLPGAVYLVSTPGHGGLMCERGWGRRTLRPAVRAQGPLFEGAGGTWWYAFEEDCALALPLLDNGALLRAFWRLCGAGRPEMTLGTVWGTLVTTLRLGYPALAAAEPSLTTMPSLTNMP